MQNSVKFTYSTFHHYIGLIRIRTDLSSRPSHHPVIVAPHLRLHTCKYRKYRPLPSSERLRKKFPSPTYAIQSSYRTFAPSSHFDDRRAFEGSYTCRLPCYARYKTSIPPPLLSISIRTYAPEKTKVEETVKALKEEVSSKGKQELVPKPAKKKKPLPQRILDEIKHYYHGFRLLFVNVKVSASLAFKMLRGKPLSRREHRLFIRTVSDMFRVIPMAIIIVVPFMELLLPVLLMLFPGMMPSTFQTASEKEMKAQKALRLKLEMAKFLQDTLGEMTLQGAGGKTSESAKEFKDFFQKVKASGRQVSNEDILKFSKLFEDELTLDNLSRPQLVALCHLLELQPFGTTKFLNFELRMRLRNLKADDKVIKKEGVENLNMAELQNACKARGMRSVGLTEDRLREELTQWLALSLTENIPPSLLLLSRALYLSEEVPQVENIAKTISKLPEAIALGTEAKISEREGKIDNKVRLQMLQEEQKAIKAEKEEEKLVSKMEQQAKDTEDKKTVVGKAVVVGKEAMVDKEELIDKAPVLAANEEEELKVTPKELGEIGQAIAAMSVAKKQLLIEKEQLAELKEEMEDYKEDIEELKDVVAQSADPKKLPRESKAAARLSKQVNRLVSKMHGTIEHLEEKLAEEKKVAPAAVPPGDEMISVSDLISTMAKMKEHSNNTRIGKISSILMDMDLNKDGYIKVDELVKIMEILNMEKQEVTKETVKEIMEMLEKEENLHMVEKIEKVMDQKQPAQSQVVRAQPAQAASQAANVLRDAAIEARKNPPPPP